MKLARIAATFISLFLASASAAAQGDFASQLLSDQRRDALRELERGNAAEQVKAAERLGVEFAAQTAPVLAKHLSDRDTAVRLSAASTLWSLAGKSPAAFADAKPALQAALDDVNAEVAMSAAGALSAMKVPAEVLAPARRRVLQQGHPQPYVLFLAARGLIGIDPSASLAPALVAYLEHASAAASRGGTRDNVQLARSALERLADTQERAPILVMQEQLRKTRTSHAVLMRVLHRYSPRPDGWTDTLLQQAGSQDRDVAATAWDLLAGQNDAASLAKWAPRAATLLGVSERREMALSALRGAAGRTTLGLAELAALATNKAVPEAERLRAIDILGSGADTHREDRVPEVTHAARAQWLAVCEPVFTGAAPGKLFDSCLNPLTSAIDDRKERARHLGRWLAANGNADVKIEYLGRLESVWSDAFDAADVVKSELSNSDARVKASAEKALDRIRPAWREAAARQERQAGAPAVKTAPVPAGPAAEGGALYAAVRTGDVAQVKKLVTRANVLQPVRFPQMANPPTPIQVALNHCGLPNLPATKLAEIVAYLLSLGANPDMKDFRGDNVLDRAKYSCPPEVMKVLAG